MITFKGEPEKGQIVNHKNGVIRENHPENLEYCTYQHNNAHAFRVLKRKATWKEKYGVLSPTAKLIGQFDLNGNFIRTFYGSYEAERATGVDHSTISKCCRDHKDYSQTGGYKWKYL